MFKLAIFAIAALFVSGCASVSDIRDLSGDWRFRVDVAPERATHGALQLERVANGYSGTLTTDQGANVLPVQRFVVDGRDVAMIVASPDGPVTFDGALAADGRSFSGVVTYHNGARYPLTAERRG